MLGARVTTFYNYGQYQLKLHTRIVKEYHGTDELSFDSAHSRFKALRGCANVRGNNSEF